MKEKTSYIEPGMDEVIYSKVFKKAVVVWNNDKKETTETNNKRGGEKGNRVL